MNKIKEYKVIIIIGLIILGGIFYWFQIRPAKIIKKCIIAYPKAFSGSYSGKFDKAGYDKCLREWGLVK